MKRFENAEIGDLVYCRLMGLGTIINTKYSTNYPIKVSFIRPPAKDDTYTDAYTLDGRAIISNIEPTLFYRSSTDNYLTERPEPDVDWAIVEIGTLIEVCDDLSENDWSVGNLLVYLPHHKLPYWAWSLWDSTHACGFKHARLAKETPTCQKA